jgi:PhnB protein
MAAQPQTSGLSPYLFPKGGKAGEMADFYIKAFGATDVGRMKADDGSGRYMHINILVNGCNIMMSDEFPEHSQSRVRPMGGFTLHLAVDDVDAWYDRAVAAGCTPVGPPQDQFWGERFGTLRDPYEVDWSIGGPVKG